MAKQNILAAVAAVRGKKSPWRLVLGASALTGISLVTAAGAASAADTNATASNGDTLGEILVTAQRREERLSDVPISVTAVTSDELARDHIDDVSRLQFLTPGLTWGQQGSDSFPAIRGARTSLVSAQNDPIIAFYIDGIYQSRTQQQSIPLFDVSRVEVERGPQGTLYGRNTFGGNFSVVTNEPTNQFETGVNMEVGNFAHNRVDAYINLPISDTLEVRISGIHQQHSGYVHSVTTPGVTLDDDNEDAGRINVKWAPTDQLEVLLHAGQWDRDDAGAGSYGYKVAGTLINPNTGYQSIFGVPTAVNPSVHNGTDVLHGVDIGVPVSGGPWENDWDYQPFEHIHESYASGSISYDFGPVVLKSLTGYTDFHAHRSADNDQTNVIFEAPTEGFGTGIQEPTDIDHAFSEEVQLTSKETTPVSWIVGGYYLHDDVNEVYQQLINAPNPTVDGYKETTALTTEAYAGFAQASWFVVPDFLRVIGGVRESYEKKSFAFADYADGIPGTFIFTTPYSQTSGAPSFTSTTWRAGLEMTPDHNSMYYATVSTGFESGGFNDTGGDKAIPSSYAPQKVTAYEIGAKNKFADGRVQTELSVVDNQYTDLQINVYTPQVSYFGSAGKAYARGAEFAVKTLPAQNFHVDLTAAYLRARYTYYISGNPWYGASNGTDPVSVDLAGRTIPNSPSFKTTVGVYYDFDMGDRGTIAPYVGWLYSTGYYTTDYNTDLDKQGAYNLVDLSLRWTAATGKIYAELYGNNVGNVPVLMSGVVGRDQRVQVSYGPPALFGLRVGFKY
jgi:iron complex outermembrane recepter protein